MGSRLLRLLLVFHWLGHHFVVHPGPLADHGLRLGVHRGVATDARLHRSYPERPALHGYKNFANKFWRLEINIGQVLTIW